MRSFVTLTIRNGKYAGKTFVCPNNQTCTIGRGEDCQARLPMDKQFRSVSRHHCQLEVRFPHVWVRDCHSQNGTFVNGTRVPAQETAHPWLRMLHLSGGLPQLKDGDNLQLGSVAFKVFLIQASNTTMALVNSKAHAGLRPIPANSSDYEEIRWEG